MEVEARLEKPGERERPAPRISVNDLIFAEPELVEEITQSIIAVPVHSMIGFSVEEIKKTRVEYQYISKLSSTLFVGAPTHKAVAIPRWRYYPSSDNVLIGDAVNTMLEFLRGASVYTRASDFEEFTRKSFLNKPFKVSDQLLYILNKMNRITSVSLPNDGGGVDIVALVESQGASETYPVVLSIREEAGRPVVYSACGCPLGGHDALFCKHKMVVLATHAHIVLGAIDYIATKRGTLEKHVEYWRKRLDTISGNLTSETMKAAFVYYLTKFLIRKGVLYNVELTHDKLEALKGYMDMLLKWNTEDAVEAGVLEKVAREVVEKDAVFKNLSIKKVKWTPEMKVIRETLLKVIHDIKEKFGVETDVPGEWPTILVYALVESADHTKPPTVIHVVGDIGTFKTTGPRLLAEYVSIPLLEAVYRGRDVQEKYRRLLELLSERLSIPLGELEGRVGGVIAGIAARPDSLRVSLSLPYIYSVARRRGGKELVEGLLQDLRREGFALSVRTARPRVGILDPAQVSNIEDYRFRYLPDSVLGLLTVMDVFDNYILVIDEGSRNPRGLESLLTKMSTATPTEGVRVIVVTDNIEPFQEVIGDPRYAPLHDRTYKALTRSAKDEISVMERLYRPPAASVDALTLLAAHNFVEKIPVPEGVLFLAKAVGDALAYKYALINDGGVEYFRPIRRGERYPVSVDLLEDMDVGFVSGGRYLYHTLRLSKFIAFLNGHDHVTVEDLEEALIYTLKSRLIVESSTYSDYKIKVVRVIEKVKEALKHSETVLSTVMRFIAAAKEGDADKMRSIYEEAVVKSSTNPFMAAAITSALELLIVDGVIGLETYSKLPDNVKRAVAEIIVERGDLAELIRYMGERGVQEAIERRVKEERVNAG